MPRTSPFIPGNGKRPPPPAGLDAREAAIWRQITKRLPVDWFVAEPLLKELCRHIRICDDLAGDIARARAAVDEIRGMPEPPAKLLLAAMREYRALAILEFYRRAAEARRMADRATNRPAKTDFLAIEQRWLSLAHSCEVETVRAAPRRAPRSQRKQRGRG